MQNDFSWIFTKEEGLLKKKIIIIVLIITLFAVAVGVNFIAMKQKQQNAPMNISQNDIPKENLQSQEENNEEINAKMDALELSGNQYKPETVVDKEGNSLTANLEENKPMITLYWNTKEEASKEALKFMQEKYSAYKDRVTFTAIATLDNMEEEKPLVESFITENNIEIPIVYSTSDSSNTVNEIANIPTILVINKDGQVINTLINNITVDVIEANLDIITENF